jgi:hypothetical protein
LVNGCDRDRDQPSAPARGSRPPDRP